MYSFIKASLKHLQKTLNIITLIKLGFNAAGLFLLDCVFSVKSMNGFKKRTHTGMSVMANPVN